ncbi:MAG: glycosyltransferase family 9 protein [Phycisphaerales bacterium]
MPGRRPRRHAKTGPPLRYHAVLRILATNPDTLGDALLRQPLYRALGAEGHELMLVARPLVVPLLPLIAPGARVFTVEADLYNPALTHETGALDAVSGAARDFDPDLLLIAPFQWTILEERLAKELPRARLAALSGRRFADPDFGAAPPPALSPSLRVDVAEDCPELRKNELLAGAVLGRAVTLPDPAIAPTPAMLRAAETALARLGLAPGSYWAACVGDTPATRIRNWRPQRWAEALSRWAGAGERFLLIGHSSEEETSREILGAMGDAARACALWSGEGGGDLDTLLGLIAHSRGYVGRDTGPMHLAAAMDRPVLAVFGGGTWPRFLPAARRSVSLAVGVPCVGCGWHCELTESYCITEVPVVEVLRAFDDLRKDDEEVKRGAGEEVRGPSARRVRLLDPGARLLTTIAREAAHASRDRRVTLSVLRREHMDQTQALTGVLERSVKRAGEADRLSAEADGLRTEMQRREAVLRARLAAEQGLWKAREADLLRRIREVESAEAGAAQQVVAARAEARARLDENTHLREELVKARADADDSRLREVRLRNDQHALAALTRQQDEELSLARQRLNDLAASRWRKYGQRLHLCMTLPWEREMSNGRH